MFRPCSGASSPFNAAAERSVLLDVPLHAVDLILQLPSRSLKCVIDREIQIGVPFVFLRGVVDIDFATAGKRQTDIHLLETAAAMMAAGCFQCHTAGGHATVTLFEFTHMLCDSGTNILPRIHALEIDLDRCLHDVTSMKSV
jgi:hypothetical protein